MSESIVEKLQRLVYREFLLEPGLAAEAGLEQLPGRLAARLACGEHEAVAHLTQHALLEPLALPELKELLAIRDMTLVSRTAAAVSASLKDEGVSYDTCCRTALCYAVIGMAGHVLGALRAAGGKNDSWARHHFLYGLILGLGGDVDRGRWELGMALQYEPYAEAKARIRCALDILDSRL